MERAFSSPLPGEGKLRAAKQGEGAAVARSDRPEIKSRPLLPSGTSLCAFTQKGEKEQRSQIGDMQGGAALYVPDKADTSAHNAAARPAEATMSATRAPAMSIDAPTRAKKAASMAVEAPALAKKAAAMAVKAQVMPLAAALLPLVGATSTLVASLLPVKVATMTKKAARVRVRSCIAGAKSGSVAGGSDSVATWGRCIGAAGGTVAPKRGTHPGQSEKGVQPSGVRGGERKSPDRGPNRQVLSRGRARRAVPPAPFIASQ